MTWSSYTQAQLSWPGNFCLMPTYSCPHSIRSKRVFQMNGIRGVGSTNFHTENLKVRQTMETVGFQIITIFCQGQSSDNSNRQFNAGLYTWWWCGDCSIVNLELFRLFKFCSFHTIPRNVRDKEWIWKSLSVLWYDIPGSCLHKNCQYSMAIIRSSNQQIQDTRKGKKSTALGYDWSSFQSDKTYQSGACKKKILSIYAYKKELIVRNIFTNAYFWILIRTFLNLDKLQSRAQTRGLSEQGVVLIAHMARNYGWRRRSTYRPKVSCHDQSFVWPTCIYTRKAETALSTAETLQLHFMSVLKDQRSLRVG